MRDLIGIFFILLFGALAVLQGLTRERRVANDAGLQALARETIADVKPQAGDWPTWRGLTRDGIAPDQIRGDWPEDGPVKLWEQPTGEGYSAVTVANELVFAFFQVGGDETLVAFDRLTGSERWRFGSPTYYKNNYGNGPRSSPTVDGERVYVVGGMGRLTCVDVKTGQKVWDKDLLAEFQAATPQWGIAFSPLVDGDRLIVCPGGEKGSVVALDKRTGGVLWTSLKDAGGYSSPLLANIGGQTQLVAFTAAGLVGLDRDKGTVLWQFPWVTAFDCNVATPIVVGDYAFITSGYDRGCALIHIEKAGAGWSAEAVYQNSKMRSHFASCVRFGDTIYGFDESTLVALNLRDGAVHWKKRGFGKGSLLGVGGQLLVLGEGGACALAEASPKEYREIARFPFSDERCWTAPTVAHGLLYLRDQKTLACFDVGKHP